MEKYEILSVDENSSMEEIRQAYENKVNEIKKEIVDERRAKAFIKVFDKAFEEIKLEKEKIQNQETMLINFKNTNLDNYAKDKLDIEEIDKYEDFDEYKEITRKNKEKKKSPSRSSTRKKQNNNRKKVYKDNDIDKKKRKNNNQKIRSKERLSKESSLIKLPFKILAVPIIVVLSILIFLLKTINLISWIATKVLIVAAISVSSIHGYQVYIGQPMYYEVFVLCAVVFVISLFLPSILKVVPSALSSINNKIKKFVFN
ncbi:molecular chaperone DnaJ [Clostridium sp. AL.422]|uniref:molecular chaperone DnaJ n=1 Tax=Clostridium TaxID=1485 RepID=UPI00293DE17C|nr:MULTISPECIES: molecular chaperone DnaJ [unclassified Clostridium]MDV4149423.1 molecular chaperone DnaJ [Clostridium sp. AL.422]